MSHAEALQWAAYLERRGTANLGLRIESGFALIAFAINRALGGHAEMTDFMPSFDASEATLDDVMKILSGKQ